jgi:hypothetical protein
VNKEPAHVSRQAEDGDPRLVRRHLLVGWWCVLLFLVLGLGLETLHGLKVGWYVNVSSSMRRLMWTLAHAHGTLLGLLNLAFAWTLHVGAVGRRAQAAASASLIGASVLLPGGFFLGGVVIYGGDPGFGVYVTPIGAVLLVVALGLTLRHLRYPRDGHASGGGTLVDPRRR